MRKVIGWVIIVFSFLLLGFFLNLALSEKTQPLSPIPNDDAVRVIMLSPSPTN